ncbi:MAG: hypothetical protein IH991_11180 [Planctomycetes bacterium]|nr:hypothetical protein [Planctomycetota bacterium]
MDSQPTLPLAIDSTATQPPPVSAVQRGRRTAADIIQVEANLLGLPFFALAKKDRLHRQAIEVIGTRTKEDGTSESFRLRVSRNTDHGFPGVLSRRVHFGFLDILAGQPRPIQNPITWTWRGLHQRMGVTYGGRDSIARMKEAIHDTASAYIKTNCALMAKSGDDKAPLPDRETGYHLYDKVVFVNDVLPDGSVADRNAVWFSDWYLANLNAFYSGPLNRSLWRELEAERPTASRLYEILQYKCCKDIPVLKINYATLAPLIPVRIESAFTKAQEQLNPAFEALGKRHVVRRIEWTVGKSGNTLLHIYPGPALKRNFFAASQVTATPRTVLDFDSVHVCEVFDRQTREQKLVSRYHALRFGRSRYQPAACELKVAREKIEAHGESLLNRVLPKVTKRMEEEFPKGKYFNAASKFIDQAVEAHQQDQQARARRHADDKRAIADEKRVEQKKRKLRKRATKLWATFSPSVQERLWNETIDSAPSDFDRTQLKSARADGKLHVLLLRQIEEHVSMSQATAV